MKDIIKVFMAMWLINEFLTMDIQEEKELTHPYELIH